MRVLSNIAGRAVELVDHAALRWLERLGDGEKAAAAEIARDVALLRRLAFAALTCLVCVPLGLSFVASPSLALPVGAALVLSVFLLAAAAAFAFRRAAAAQAPVSEPDNALFAACPGLTLVLDPHGTVVKVGGRDRQSFPSALREAEGTVLAELIHVSDRLGLMQTLDGLRQGAESALAEVRVELPFSASGGRQFQHVRLDMSALRDAEGRLLQVFAQLRDTSEEAGLRAEAARRTAEAETAHEAKSRFLAAVSHELRTPRNAILGFSDVLAGEYFGRLENDRQREYVGLIRQSGAHLLSVVNTMLDMSRIETGRYELLTEPFRIADAMESCRAMLDLSAREKDITLTCRVQKGLGDVVADRRALQQILINLAGNSIKFTDRGGVVSLDASIEGGNLILSVGDTGIGIAAEKLELVGQPFMQVDGDYARRYEGTGLGLSLVKGLVALHGGRFEIRSRLGEGTVVTVVLPADGSGASSRDRAAGEGEAIEFPPRLKAGRGTPMMDEQDFDDGHAEAKIA